MKSLTKAFFASAALLTGGSVAASAEDLTYAISAPVTSVDPHYQNASQNLATLMNIYQGLTMVGTDGMVHPSLAESYKAVSDTTWEFKLQPKATFQNGDPVTAEDVKFSLERPATITNSPSSFNIYTKNIASIDVVDDKTVRVTTKAPLPQFPRDMSRIYILDEKITAGKSTPDFNNGSVAVGTGPYEFVSYTPNDELVMKANPNYYGAKPKWDKVTVRFIPNDGARTAALLSGSVDAIENIPTQDLEKLEKDTKLTVQKAKSMRMVFLFVDSGSDKAPTVSGPNGEPLDKNPFKDVRVRQALNLAINRDAISSRLMMGLAYPSDNLVFDGGEGYIKSLDNPPYDPKKAKELLTEAGYPNGFTVTLASPNNRMINDEQVAQAIAQMFTRIGIKTQVDAMPFTTINTRGSKGDFALSMMSWGATENTAGAVRAFIACKNPEKGWGPVNWGNFCDPELDKVTEEALSTMDAAKRRGLMEKATRIIHDKMAIVPLYFQGYTWAARKGITIVARSDERTTAATFEPAS